jgi:hypothetical protein
MRSTLSGAAVFIGWLALRPYFLVFWAFCVSRLAGLDTAESTQTVLVRVQRSSTFSPLHSVLFLHPNFVSPRSLSSSVMDVARSLDHGEILCARCPFIFTTPLPDSTRKRHRHYHTVGLLRDAALIERCWVCLRVWERVKRYAMHYDSNSEISLYSTFELEPLTLNLWWIGEDNLSSLSLCIISVHGRYHNIAMVCIFVPSFPYRNSVHNPRGLVTA